MQNIDYIQYIIKYLSFNWIVLSTIFILILLCYVIAFVIIFNNPRLKTKDCK